MIRTNLRWNPGATVYAVGLVLSLGAANLSIGAQAEEYENAPVFDAMSFVPKEFLSGPNHQVDQRVINDGYMNHYTIQSRFGEFAANSNAELGIRVREINAIAAMEHVKGSDVYLSAIAGTGGKVVTGTVNLLSDPLGTLQGSASGVSKMFQRAGDTLSGKGGGDNVLTGNAKRQFAKEFGVDVYSTNEVLQKRLNELAEASALGGLTASAALMAVPGGAGALISVTKGAETLNEANSSMPPSDLARLNKERLLAMGVNPDVADLFLEQHVLTPTRQTLMIDALSSMGNTAERGQFIKFAIHTETDDLALFRQRQAQMYAAYHATVEPIVEFVAIGRFIAAQTASGKLVFDVPLDHLVWTEAIGKIAFEASALVGDVKKELWVPGTMSELARASLEGSGWQVQDKAKLVSVW